MAPSEEEALILRLRHTFTDNVKSRSEIARIRRAAAVNVASYIVFDVHDGAMPTQVKLLGKEVTGIRRRYLEALKANIEARERYHQSTSAAGDGSVSKSQGLLTNENVIVPYLESSKLQRQHQEVVIRSHYIQSLSQDASTSCDLEISQPEQSNSVQVDMEHMGDNIAAVEAQVKALITNLQKAVLQASHQLERQRALLDGFRQKQAGSLSGTTDGSHTRATAATRDILVAWLEQKLAESGADHADGMETKPIDLNRKPDGQASIKDHYQKYLDARKAFVEAAGVALMLLSPPPAENSNDQDILLAEQLTPLNDLSVVHNISQSFVPLLRKQASSTALQSFLSVQAMKESRDTIETFKRLAHESHLLSTFSAGNLSGESHIKRHVAAWKLAAQAASGLAINTVEEHEKTSQQALTNGEGALHNLKSYHDDDEKPLRKNDGIGWKGINGRLDDHEIG